MCVYVCKIVMYSMSKYAINTTAMYTDHLKIQCVPGEMANELTFLLLTTFCCISLLLHFCHLFTTSRLFGLKKNSLESV